MTHLSVVLSIVLSNLSLLDTLRDRRYIRECVEKGNGYSIRTAVVIGLYTVITSKHSRRTRKMEVI